MDENFHKIERKMEELNNSHTAATGPIAEIKSQVEEVLGNIDFPVKKTIVAQNVWWTKNEDLDKIVLKILKVVRKKWLGECIRLTEN